MTRYYKVAGHTFSVSLADESPLWGLMAQYEPFRVYSEGGGSTGTIFTMTLAGKVPEAGWQVVLDQPAADGEPVIRLLHSDEGWLAEMSPDHRIPVCARAWMSEDFSIVRLVLECRDRRRVQFAVNNALMLAFAFSTERLGTLEMHASMVSNGGKAYLFVAPSGTGKSTHTSLWLKHVPGSELMNDDNPVIRVLADGRVMAYGSPWSGKTPCYRNVQAEVGAIVKIRRSSANAITALSLPSAFAEVYSSCSGLKCDESLADGLCDSVSAVVSGVPCYVLDCRPDREAALVCAGELLGAVGESAGAAEDGELEAGELESGDVEAGAAENAGGCSRIVPNNILLGEIGNLLAEGHKVILKAKGDSMLPFVRSGVDSLELVRRDALNVGDIVLAHLCNGHYVAHRVIGIDGEEVTLKGDGNLDSTERCRRKDICGTAVYIIRPGSIRKKHCGGVSPGQSGSRSGGGVSGDGRGEDGGERCVDCGGRWFIVASRIWRGLPRFVRRCGLAVARRCGG